MICITDMIRVLCEVRTEVLYVNEKNLRNLDIFLQTFSIISHKHKLCLILAIFKLLRKKLHVNICNVTILAFFTWNFFATKFLCWSST